MPRDGPGSELPSAAPADTVADDKAKEIRAKYLEHVAKMLALAGEKPEQAKTDADVVLEMETDMAKAAMDPVARRDPKNLNNKMSLAQVKALTPSFDWDRYLKLVQTPPTPHYIVTSPSFFKNAEAMLNQHPLEHWRIYLRWQMLHGNANSLSTAFVDENFDFNERILRGTQQDKPRWKRVVISEDGDIGEALGKLYVGFYFPPAAKERALELVNNLKEALADRIKTLDWMDEPTKQEALKKLAAMNVKIGYPDKWLDYSLLPIDRGPYVLNALRAAKFESDRDVQKIGKPVDRTDWGMTPPTVNAYYQPNMNEIVFPAGILQPPFFYAHADDAVNYGAIGAVIGHEMTHGFDDQGRQFDAAGNLRDWWSKKSADEYNKRRKAVVDQYSAYEPLPGMHVNGELTQGENIADIGGLKLAYAALQKALDKHPEERGKKIDGLTPEQRFFLSFAAIWRSKIRDEDQKLRLTTDPHSPAQFRVNGPLTNMPEFQKAFNVPDGAAMVRPPDKRVNIW